MGHGKGKSASSYEKAPVPVADYNVTGEIDPDARCNYFEAETFHGQPYYRRADGLRYIWFDAVSWVISQNLGSYAGAGWNNLSVDITGLYVVTFGGAVGIPLVSIGPH